MRERVQVVPPTGLYYRVRSVRYLRTRDRACMQPKPAVAARGTGPVFQGGMRATSVVTLHAGCPELAPERRRPPPSGFSSLARLWPARSKTPEETTSARKLHRRDRITAADPRVLESSSARLRHESARLEDTAKPAGHRHEPPRLPARLGANPEHTEPRMGWNGSEPLPPAAVALVAGLQPSIHGQRRADAATIRWHQPRSIFG